MKYEILRAELKDLEEILSLQKIAFIQEAKLNNNFAIQPMMQTLDEIQEEFDKKVFLKAINSDELLGSVRAHAEDGVCVINKLIVHPYYQKKGLGSAILDEIEKEFSNVKKFQLWTGSKSKNNIRFYLNHGYTIIKKSDILDKVELVLMEKEKSK